MNHERIFTPQYTHASGPGSTFENSAPYRAFLEEFIREHSIQTILDLGCGDAEIMSNVDLRLRRNDGSFMDVQYLGVDVIPERIHLNREKHGTVRTNMHFVQQDLREFLVEDRRDLKTMLEPDLVICKDVLQHWSNDEIDQFLKLTIGWYPFMLVTNCNYDPPAIWPSVNTDIQTGDWRPLDIMKSPFNVRGEVALRYGTRSTGGIKDVVLIKS